MHLHPNMHREATVPNVRGTPQRAIAVPQERWDAFREVATALGTDRSKLLNTVMAWYLREPNTVLPRRPVMPPHPSDADD